MLIKSFRQLLSWAAVLTVLLGTGTTATAQDAYQQEYYEEDSYRGIESEIESALDYDYGVQNGMYGWEYEEWGNEWEYDFPGGEIEFDPQRDAEAMDPEAGIRQALNREGEWTYDDWEGEWEYEYDGGEIEYDPTPSYYRGGAYGRGYGDYWYDDWYGYGWYGFGRYEDPRYRGYGTSQGLDERVETALDSPNGYWEYEPLQQEWEYDYPGGEIEYEPPAGGANVDPQARVRRALEQDLGTWEYEPWQGEWEYEYNGEIDYEPYDYYEW